MSFFHEKIANLFHQGSASRKNGTYAVILVCHLAKLSNYRNDFHCKTRMEFCFCYRICPMDY